jgi:Gnt-I system high-affinity gluconate transporter
MPLILCFAGILCLILLVVWCKLDTFISFILISVGLGLASGMDIHQISGAIQKGIANILGSLVIILGFGAMLGKLVADSGAAQQIMESLTRISGIRHIQWAMALAGLMVGIPLFYTAGFVVVMPLIFAVGATTRLPLVYLGIPMLSALSVAHGFLPPHPSPTTIAQQLHADLGKTLLYGLIAGIPAIAIAGPLFGKTLRKYDPVPDPALLTVKMKKRSELPGLGLSLLTALMPLVLLTATTIFGALMPPAAGATTAPAAQVATTPAAGSVTMTPIAHPGLFRHILDFIGDPNMVMLLSLLVAIYFLGLRRGQSMTSVMKSLEEAFKGVSPVLLVIAGSGVFMQVMSEAGVNQYIGEYLKNAPLSPLLLGWGIAGLIRIATGSATVAGLTAAGIILPLLGHHPEIHPEFMVLAIGAGSLMFSHVNDGGFWLFKQYFNLSIRQTFATWTVMETLVSVVGLLVVLLLNYMVY